MLKRQFLLWVIFSFLCYSCNNAGKPDSKSNINDNLITSERISNVKIGGSLDSLEKYYKNYKIKKYTRDYNYEEGDSTYSMVYEIVLGKDEYLLAESQTDNWKMIHSVSTNSKKFITESGYRVGDPIRKLIKNNEKVDYDMVDDMVIVLSGKTKFRFETDSVGGGACIYDPKTNRNTLRDCGATITSIRIYDLK